MPGSTRCRERSTARLSGTREPCCQPFARLSGGAQRARTRTCKRIAPPACSAGSNCSAVLLRCTDEGDSTQFLWICACRCLSDGGRLRISVGHRPLKIRRHDVRGSQCRHGRCGQRHFHCSHQSRQGRPLADTSVGARWLQGSRSDASETDRQNRTTAKESSRNRRGQKTPLPLKALSDPPAFDRHQQVPVRVLGMPMRSQARPRGDKKG